MKYNSTYISSNLIDELDFVIGGYGKPNVAFIYSLNTFLEGFILNTNFYSSVVEIRHTQLLSSSLFPLGRPILDMLAGQGSFYGVHGVGNDKAKVVSITEFDPANPTSYQERIESFVREGMDTTEARREYLVIADVNAKQDLLPFFSLGQVEGGIIGTVSYNRPGQLFQQLCEVTKSTNLQAVLPLYSYKFQLEEMQGRGIGRELINTLSQAFQKKIEHAHQYFGFRNQSIPPLVTILLSQCKTIAEIPRKMLQLREDFTPLRKAIESFEKRIAEADTIKQQVAAIDELDQFWKVFQKKYSADRRLLYQFWEVAEGSGYEQALDNAVDDRSISSIINDLNAGKVIGKGVKKIIDWYKERKIVNRFKGLTDIWKLFEKSPGVTEQMLAFERLFQVTIKGEDIALLNKKISEISMPKK